MIPLPYLKDGKPKSCGCYKKEKKTTHGKCKSSEYVSWVNMKQRCYNKNNKGYKRYGGRGITVCDRWLNSFENFYEDMGNKPSKKHSLERIDNNKGYFPENCRWDTQRNQVINQEKINSQKYIGVRKVNKTFRTSIQYNNNVINIGYFSTELEAAKAYDDESEKIYGDRPNQTKKAIKYD